MKVEVCCPSCSKVSLVPEEYLGRKARCAKCKAEFVLARFAPPPRSTSGLSNLSPAIAENIADEVLSQPFADTTAVSANVTDMWPPVAHVEPRKYVDEPESSGVTPIYSMRGVQDLLEVFSDKVTITPKGVLGFLNKGIKGTKEIPYISIIAVQFKEAGAVFSGYLQFTIPGGNESGGGIWSATRDENTFMFAHTENNPMAKQIKDFIDSAIRESRSPRAGPSPTNLSSELAALAVLREQGHLTEEEFQAAKRRLIG